MKIDAWADVLPKEYLDRISALPSGPHNLTLKLLSSVPQLYDMDLRFRKQGFRQLVSQRCPEYRVFVVMFELKRAARALAEFC
jgi:hypothetical protein